MDRALQSFVDDTIRSFATYQLGVYTLEIDDLHQADQLAFIDKLLTHDPGTLESLKDRMQDLIEERLGFIEAEDNYEAGLKPLHDPQTGEVYWVRRPA